MKKLIFQIVFLLSALSCFAQVNTNWSWYSNPAYSTFNSAACFQQAFNGNFINAGQSGAAGAYYAVDGIGNLQSVKFDSISGAGVKPITGLCDSSGFSYFVESIFGTGVDSARILKFNWNLSIAWSKNFQYERPVDVAVDPNQNIIMLSDSDKVILRKIDPNGNVLWVISNDSAAGNNHILVKQLKIDNAGNIYVLSMKTVTGDQEYSMKKFSGSGSFIWETDFNPGLYKDEPNNLFIDTNCNLYVTGSSYVTSNGNQRAYATLKMDSTGLILWSNAYSTYSNVGRKIMSDGLGNAYIAGSRIESNGQKFLDIIKYDNNGDTMWTYSSDSLAIVTQGLFRTMGLLVDANGNSVVVFQREVAFAVADYYFTIAQVDPNGNAVETVLESWGRHWSPYVFTNSSNQIFVGGDFIPDCGGSCQNSLFIFGLDNLAGIHDLSTKEIFNFYPNPSNGEINIKGNFPEKSELQFFDLLGNAVCDPIFITEGEQSIRLRVDLRSGIYLCKVVSEGEIISEDRLIILNQ